MDVVITEWALKSYLELKHDNVFTTNDYKTILRPDAGLLKLGWPPSNPKFSNSKFWGPAKGLGGVIVQHGFKMKWHNFGPRKAQFRLAVAEYGGQIFLCQAYVKTNDAKDKREIAILKNRIRDISQGNYQYRGKI